MCELLRTANLLDFLAVREENWQLYLKARKVEVDLFSLFHFSSQTLYSFGDQVLTAKEKDYSQVDSELAVLLVPGRGFVVQNGKDKITMK